MAEENAKSTLAQMNQILAEKEAVIDKKKQELISYRKELDDFEAELVKRTNDLKEAQEKLSEEQRAFKLYKQSEEKSIEERWSELRSYEENLEKSMEEVLEEKLLLQSQSVEQMEKDLEKDISLSHTSEQLNLNKLRESVGIPKVEPLTVKAEEPMIQKKEDIEEVVQKSVPEMFNLIQTEVEKNFKMQKPFVLEKTPERMCMKLGTRELRVFDNNPYPELHLVINWKNAKSDTKLQRVITSAARTIPDWQFEAELNQLVCRLLFKADEPTKNLIKKIKECIDKIEG